jgi:hypothetical protein
MTRDEIRVRVRDYLYESSADLWSDAQINRLYEEETRSLPEKDVYLEELWTTSTVADQIDYTLPDGTVKVELVERNYGTSTKPDWGELSGWDNYSGALYLPYTPTDVESIRIHIKKRFTVVTDDVTALDLPDEKTELLVWGIVVRAYQMLIGYLRGSVSWDSVTKPGDVAITSVGNWLRDARDHYRELTHQFQTTPKPREINLTS